MKFPKVSCFYFLLSLCVISINSMASDLFEEYLNSSDSFRAHDKYNIMAEGKFTEDWNKFAKRKESKGLKANDRLSAALCVRDSYQALAETKEIQKNKEAASELSKRISVATQLISEDKIKVSGKATPQSNLAYLKIALTEGSDLAALEAGRLEAKVGKKYDDSKAFAILLHSFNFNKAVATPSELTPENLLRFQLAALAFHGYTLASSGGEKGLAYLKEKLSVFNEIIQGLESLMASYNSSLQRFINQIKPKTQLSKSLRTAYKDPQQTCQPVSELEGKGLLLFMSSPSASMATSLLPPLLLHSKHLKKAISKWQLYPYLDPEILQISDGSSSPPLSSTPIPPSNLQRSDTDDLGDVLSPEGKFIPSKSFEDLSQQQNKGKVENASSKDIINKDPTASSSTTQTDDSGSEGEEDGEEVDEEDDNIYGNEGEND